MNVLITDQLDRSAFTNVMTQLIHSMTFLVDKQRQRMTRNITDSLQYHYSPNTPFMRAQYQKLIQQHQTELVSTAQGDSNIPANLR